MPGILLRFAKHFSNWPVFFSHPKRCRFWFAKSEPLRNHPRTSQDVCGLLWRQCLERRPLESKAPNNAAGNQDDCPAAGTRSRMDIWHVYCIVTWMWKWVCLSCCVLFWHEMPLIFLQETLKSGDCLYQLYDLPPLSIAVWAFKSTSKAVVVNFQGWSSNNRNID